MVFSQYGHNLFPRTECFIGLKSAWTPQAKAWVLERMRASKGNLKPIIIIDDVTKKSKCYMYNATLTAFTEESNPLLCNKIDLRWADFMVKRSDILKSNKTVRQKEEDCFKNEMKVYFKKSDSEITKLTKEHMKSVTIAT